MNALTSHDLSYAVALMDEQLTEHQRTMELLACVPSVPIPDDMRIRMHQRQQDMAARRMRFAAALCDALQAEMEVAA